MFFFKCFLVFDTILFAFTDLSFSIDIFFRNLLFKNFLLSVSEFLRFWTVFTLFVICFFFLVSDILKLITFLNKYFSAFLLSFLLLHGSIQLSCKKFLKFSKLLDESTHLLRFMFISSEFKLILRLTKESYQFSNVLSHVQSTLSGFWSAQVAFKRGHVDSIVDADCLKLLFEVGLSEQVLSYDWTEVVNDLLIIFLFQLFKEICVQ